MLLWLEAYMPNPKRQHYVPQCYLKEFRDPLSLEDNPSIYVFKTEGKEKPWKQKLKEVCVTGDIYTFIDQKGNKDYSLEIALSQIEGEYVKVLDKIKRRESLTEEEHAHLCLFVAALMFRTLRQKENFEGFIQKMIDMAKQEAAVHPGEKINEQIRQLEQEKKNVHKENLRNNLGEIAALIARMNVGFACAERTPKRFITSDDPCHLYNPDLKWQRFYGPGLMQKHVELSLPLTPDTLLLMSWQNYRGYIHIEDYSYIDEQNRRIRSMSHKYFLCPVKNSNWYWFSKYPLELTFFIDLIRFQFTKLVHRFKLRYGSLR